MTSITKTQSETKSAPHNLLLVKFSGNGPSSAKFHTNQPLRIQTTSQNDEAETKNQFTFTSAVEKFEQSAEKRSESPYFPTFARNSPSLCPIESSLKQTGVI